MIDHLTVVYFHMHVTVNLQDGDIAPHSIVWVVTFT